MAPKAKKPLTAKAKMKLKAAKAAEKQRLIDSGEYVAPVAKPKISGFAKKVLHTLAGKSVAEATVEYKERSATAAKEFKEAQAVEAVEAKKVADASAAYEQAKLSIAQSMEQERETATSYKELTSKRAEMTKKVEEARKNVYEGQKKQAMLEVLAVNHAKMKTLEETRKRAQAAAEKARQDMLESKQREKEALEGTRRALAEARAEQKGAGKRAKKVQDSFPATQTDGQAAAADID